MYIKLDETKINILAEVHDDNTLTLHIKPDLDMADAYELFHSNNLSTIIVYNDEDSMIAAYSGYEIIEAFFFVPLENKYIINLSKYNVGNLQEDVKKCMEKCDKINESFATIQNGDFTKQSGYALQTLASTFTDEQALNCILLFSEWDGNGVTYLKDDRVRYKNKLFKALLEHISQLDWIPGATPSLYVEIADPSIEYPEWKKPTGAHDAYSKGDKVTYNGRKYVSTINANTYSPDEYPAGWELIEE